MKHRGGWPKLVHLSADYARYSGTTTMCPHGLKARGTVQSCCPSSYKAACLRDATTAIMRITWMDTVTNKDILEWTVLPSMEDLLIRKNLRWTGHLMRMSPDRLKKADYLLSTVFRSQKERAPSSPVQGYHQEKHEAERDIKTDSWTPLSEQRDKWRVIVK